MQILIALPDMNGIETAAFRKVCGVPLLERAITTARRNGGAEVLVLAPPALPADRLQSRLKTNLLASVPIETLPLEKAFDPDRPEDWEAIASHLDDRFLWLPWNFVPDRKALAALIEAGSASGEGAQFASRETQESGPALPAVVVKEKLKGAGSLAQYLAGSSVDVVSTSRSPGITVESAETARQAERELVRRSGKDSDGIYSKANRFLVRPVVRWLSHTPVTPNMVTFSGSAAAALSGYVFAQGHWGAYVLGAILYFVTVLIDEIDGMLARTTFRESAFGCWFETYVDYATYIFVFGGMTAGLYRESGAAWLAGGALLMAGTLMSFVVLIRQRKLATEPGRPQEYRVRLHRTLEADSANLFSRFGRLAETFVRHGALCYYVFLFTVLGGVKVLFLIAVFGSNLLWMLVLHYNRLFRRTAHDSGAVLLKASETPITKSQLVL